MATKSGKPILPVPNRIDSFWLTERDIELKAWRSTAELPSSADVVIVGSGLTGAMTCYHIYRQAEEAGQEIPRIVMLEADETTGSATARNGELYSYTLLLSQISSAYTYTKRSMYILKVQAGTASPSPT